MSFLSTIYLRNFRQFRELDLEFSPGRKIMVGANGSGKTTVLEAVYYLSILRSFRTANPRYLKHFDADDFRVEGNIMSTTYGYEGDGTNISKKLAVTYEASGSRHWYVDRCKVYRATDYINTFVCSVFVPEDIETVKGPPREKRRFLDILISQIDSNYVDCLRKYNHALSARNAALKDIDKFGIKGVQSYDNSLSYYGSYLIETRRQTVCALNRWMKYFFNVFFDSEEKELDISYEPGIPEAGKNPVEETHALSNCLKTDIEQNIKEDLDKQSTRIGPHRDNITLSMNNKSVRWFASEGECRLISLVLKQAARKVKEENNIEDVVLVDDVLGELDEERRINFLKSFSTDRQILITTTKMSDDLSKFASDSIDMEKQC